MTPDPFAPDVVTVTGPNGTLPSGTEKKIPLSEKIAQARDLLLKTLQNQLAEPLVKKLAPQERGVPFLDIDQQPPQIAAIEKVVNCLFHAEESFRIWENLDFSTSLAIAQSTPRGVSALTQVYKAVALLYDTSPEIQTLITNNYELLRPVFSEAYDVIQQSGWLPQFAASDVVDMANTVLGTTNDVLTAKTQVNDHHNSFVTVFTTFSQLMNLAADLQLKTLSETEKNSKLALFHSLLDGLDKISVFHQLSVDQIGESGALKSFVACFSTIEDPQQFIQGYIRWANKYLTSLVASIDQIELKNYLKPGILSQDLCAALDRIEAGFSSSGMKYDEPVVSTKSLVEMRKALIDESEIGYVKEMITLEDKKEITTKFFKILQAYAGKSLAAITEEDRHQLRQIYPKIQQNLAHENLELENQLTQVLNITGGDKETSWSAWALGKVSYGVSYFKSSAVDKILAIQPAINKALDKQLQSEQLKLVVAEKAKESLGIQNQIGQLKIIDELKIPVTVEERASLEAQVRAGTVIITFDENKPSSYVITPRQSFEDKVVAQLISAIKSDLTPEPQSSIISAGDLVAFKSSGLKNFRGYIASLQELCLSATINSTRTVLSSIICARLSEKDRPLFTKPPYEILDSDPALVKAVKQIENSLFNLEHALDTFEKLEWSKGIIANTKALWDISMVAYQLKNSVISLTPEARNYLAPVLKQINSYSTALSKIRQQNNDVSLFEELKKPPLIIEPVEALALSEPAAEESQNKEPLLDIYIKQIFEARALFFSRAQNTLAAPLVQYLMPQEKGVPFVHFDIDPPQISVIKKIFNSFYYAEEALKALRDMGDTGTIIGKITAVPQGVIAVSHLYKLFKLITEAAPEIQSLIQDNADLFGPVFNQMRDVFHNAAWFSQFNAGELGSMLGQGINTFFPGKGSQQYFSLVSSVSEIPKALHQISEQLGSKSKTTIKKLSISPKIINALDDILEMVAEDEISIKLVTEGMGAYKGLIKLSTLIYKESGHLTENTVSVYQAWMKEDYPKLLAMLDDLEIRYYLKPGTLSQPVREKIELIGTYVKPWIKPNERQLDQERVQEYRVDRLGSRYKSCWSDFLKIERQQQRAADHFFSILNKYQKNVSISMLSNDDQMQLKKHFIVIQEVLARGSLDVANELSRYFNGEKTTLTFDKIIQQSTFVTHFLKQQSSNCQFKIAVITNAFIEYQNPEHEAILLQEALEHFEKQQLVDIEVENAQLKTIESSVLNNISLNLESIQKLNLSVSVAQFKEQFIELSRANLSERVQSYFTKPEGEVTLHVIRSEEPFLISQLKNLENGLSHLQTALVRFESLKNSDSIFAHIKALSEINYHAQQLRWIVQNSSEEFKKQYNGSFIEKKILQLCNAVRAIDYNKLYTDDMKLMIYGDEDDPLAWLVAGARVLKSAESGIENVNHVLSTDNESSLSESQTTLLVESKNTLPEKQSTIQAYVNLIKQLKLLEERITQFASNVKDVVQLKKVIYKEFFLDLSKQEDDLYLKPGALLNPAIVKVDQFFMFMVLKLDIPFHEKRDLLNEQGIFFKDLFAHADAELEDLKQQLMSDPNNADLNLKVVLKTDKLDFFKQQMAPVEPGTNKFVEREQSLFDAQFEVYLREQMVHRILKSPILEQYEKALKEAYMEVRDNLLLPDPDKDSAKKLLVFMQKFKADNFYDYWIVNKGIEALEILHENCNNKGIKDYIQKKISLFQEDKESIKDRIGMVENLSKNKEFNSRIIKLGNGSDLFEKFKQFIETVIRSVAEGVATGGNILEIYEKKKTECELNNLGKIHLMKERLDTLKSTHANDAPSSSESFKL